MPRNPHAARKAWAFAHCRSCGSTSIVRPNIANASVGRPASWSATLSQRRAPWLDGAFGPDGEQRPIDECREHGGQRDQQRRNLLIGVVCRGHVAGQSVAGQACGMAAGSPASHGAGVSGGKTPEFYPAARLPSISHNSRIRLIAPSSFVATTRWPARMSLPEHVRFLNQGTQ